MEAGRYGYAHSAVLSENFPARHAGGPRGRELALLDLGREATTAEALAEAARRGLEPPTYEDALYFGIEHPEAQRARPIVFLHEPWVGYFGRRDVLCLWDNAGRRELGLEGYDDPWPARVRFAFVVPARPEGTLDVRTSGEAGPAAGRVSHEDVRRGRVDRQAADDRGP